MEPIHRFSLERHEGPYDQWPLTTRMLVEGEPTDTRIPGYSLLHQFATDHGYLLVTDCDCPFEESTHFILLDTASLKVLCSRRFSVPYGSYSLDAFEWIDGRSARVSFYKDDHWLLTLHPKGLPLLSPQLRVERMPPQAESSGPRAAPPS